MPLSELEAERRKTIRRIQNDIKKHGQSVVCVFDGDDPFHYTVGRHGRGLPELLMASPIDPETGMHILNALDQKMLTAVPNGTTIDLGGKYPMLIIDVTNLDRVREEFTCLASAIYGDTYRVQQTLICDKEGRFPFDPKCSPPYSRQRLLGEMSWKQ